MWWSWSWILLETNLFFFFCFLWRSTIIFVWVLLILDWFTWSFINFSFCIFDILNLFCELWNIDIVLSTTGKIVFAAPSRPLVTQQIEACHNIVGIPQVRASFIHNKSLLNTHVWEHYAFTYYEKILIKLIAGMDNWYDRSDKSYKKSMLLEN